MPMAELRLRNCILYYANVFFCALVFLVILWVFRCRVYCLGSSRVIQGDISLRGQVWTTFVWLESVSCQCGQWLPCTCYCPFISVINLHSWIMTDVGLLWWGKTRKKYVLVNHSFIHFIFRRRFNLIISFYKLSSFLRLPQNLLARCTTRKPLWLRIW